MTEGTKMAMSTPETLQAFSEWLDSQGLIVPDETPDDGTRTHDQLAREFIQQWESREGTATLAGRPHTRGRAAVDLMPDPRRDAWNEGYVAADNGQDEGENPYSQQQYPSAPRPQAAVDLMLQDDARHPGTQHLARQFSFEHLKTPLRQVSQQCHGLAAAMIRDLPDGPELSFGLRQLLLAKDAFVRAALETAKSSH